MDTLREGSSGAEVTALQTRLKERGFPPGAIDGDFGPGTAAAVIAFQLSSGLLADGVVGPRTAAALGFAEAELPVATALPEVSVAVVAKMFPQTPLDNIKRHLPTVLQALHEAALDDIPVVVAALATIRAETEGFVPIGEGISRFNTSPGGRPFDLYDHRGDLGNRGPVDGSSFKGRGFIQLTGRANYQTFSDKLGLGDALLTDPDKANDPVIAARLLAAFIKAKEIPLKQALLADDLRAARKLVNGGSHGLDRFTDAYRIGRQLLG